MLVLVIDLQGRRLRRKLDYEQEHEWENKALRALGRWTLLLSANSSGCGCSSVVEHLLAKEDTLDIPFLSEMI
jgi:hypothetical protein